MNFARIYESGHENWNNYSVAYHDWESIKKSDFKITPLNDNQVQINFEGPETLSKIKTLSSIIGRLFDNAGCALTATSDGQKVTLYGTPKIDSRGLGPYRGFRPHSNDQYNSFSSYILYLIKEIKGLNDSSKTAITIECNAGNGDTKFTSWLELQPKQPLEGIAKLTEQKGFSGSC